MFKRVFAGGRREGAYLFITGKTESSDVSKLGKIRFHLFFIETMRYPAKVDNASVPSLLRKIAEMSISAWRSQTNETYRLLLGLLQFPLDGRIILGNRRKLSNVQRRGLVDIVLV